VIASATLPSRRRLLVPAATTLCLLAVLVSLGIWQVERLAWKRGLLAAIDHAEAAPAIPLPADPTQFEKVSVTGRFLPDRAALYAAQVRDTAQGPVLGAQLLMPLQRTDAPTVIVDRGWVPEHAEIPTPPGIVQVEGYVRAAEHPGLFSATDNPASRHFYTLDPPAIARALQLGPVAPFTLVVLQSGAANAYPAPAEHLPRPPNDHLSYAITWFGLAGVLLVVFGTYVRQGRKKALLF